MSCRGRGKLPETATSSSLKLGCAHISAVQLTTSDCGAARGAQGSLLHSDAPCQRASPGWANWYPGSRPANQIRPGSSIDLRRLYLLTTLDIHNGDREDVEDRAGHR